MFYITHNTCAVMKSLLKSISHVIFLLSFLANPQFISAQTDVGGAITSNTTWTLSGSPGSPYFVLENVLQWL